MRIKYVVGSLFAALLAIGILNGIEAGRSNPVLEARQHAEELGWTPERADFLGGGYGVRWLGRFAYATLRDKENPSRSITVRLEKPLPLVDWSVKSVCVEDQDS